MQALRVEDGTVDANAFVIPAVADLHRRDTAEADADAARHWGFERQVAGDLLLLRKLSEPPQHRFRSAAEKMVRHGMLGQELCDKAMKAEAAVVAGEVDGGAGGAEIVDTSREVGAAHAIIKGD